MPEAQGAALGFCSGSVPPNADSAWPVQSARVAIALRLYGYAYEHRPWSTFGDADRIAPLNPLRRVPTLVLDDGEVLIES